MKLVDYVEMIEDGICSLDFISLLQEDYGYIDTQIFLSVISHKYSIEELAKMTNIDVNVIARLCCEMYECYLKEGEGQYDSSSLGWIDSRRFIQNKTHNGQNKY